MSASQPRKIQIAVDDRLLSGTFFAAENPQAHLVLHGATGVPQGFYRHFAAWCAERGVGVLTYDYRDFGQSRAGSLKGCTTTFSDWAVSDQSAAQAALARIAPDGPIWEFGHSLGGLGLPFRQQDSRVTRIITIGAGMVHVSQHPPGYLPKALAFWYVVGPLATALAGYMPGRRIFFGADLPAGVYWQWRRWCTRREFFYQDVGKTLPEPDFALKNIDLRIFGASDDVMMPPVAVRRYADAFAEDAPEYRSSVPAISGYRQSVISKRWRREAARSGPRSPDCRPSRRPRAARSDLPRC